MKATRLTPLLRTEKFEETLDFYARTLGFICSERNDEWGWAVMHNENVEMMIARPNAHTPFDKPIFTGSFYFNVENIEALWLELKDKTNVVYPIETFEWGMREFAIYDNNGYLLQFGEEIQ